MFDPGTFGLNTASTLSWLARTSLSAAGIAAVVIVIQLACGRWISPAWRYRLWAIVVIRLLLPALPSSPASLANLNLADRATSLWTRIKPVRVIADSNRPTLPGVVRPPGQSITDKTSNNGITVTVVTEPMMFPSTVMPPPQPAPPSAVPKVNLLPQLALIGWAIVESGLLLRLVIANIALWKRLKRGVAVEDPEVLSLLQECCAEAGVKSPPALLITSAVSAPAAAGVAKPCILIPPGLFDGLSRGEQRLVLLHELTHIRRHDVAANWVFALIQIVHWFNPILWLAFARLRADRELARDAMVLSLSKQNNPRDYVDTLLKLTESLASRKLTHLLLPPKPQVAVGMYGNKYGLKRRLHMITRFPQSPRRMDWTGPALAVVLAGALLTNARSQSTNDNPQSPTTRPTESKLPMERHAVKVPVLSEMPIVGRLFVNQVESPASQPADRSLIPLLRRQARHEMDAGKYLEALLTINQILSLDPKDDYAVGVKPLLEDKIKFASQRQYLRYPTDRPDVSQTPYNEAAAAQKTDAAGPVQGKSAGAPVPKELLSKNDRDAISQLDRTLPALQFDAVGFTDVIDFMRDISGANILVNWKALEAAGIDRNTPVNASLRNIKFSKALSIILESVGGGGVKLGYSVDDGVITVSTKDDLLRNVVVRVYDIRDLLVVIPDYSAVESVNPAPTTRPVTRDDRVTSLTKLIRDAVDPLSWKEKGGAVGAMRELDGQLIITQTPENHKQVAALLDTVRESRSLQVSVEARYLNCDQQIIRDLMDQWNRAVAPPKSVDANPTTQPAATPSTGKNFTGVFLNDAQVTQLMHLQQTSPESIIITSPRLTLFSGQHAYVKVSTSRAYLAGYTPTTKGDGEIRYEPVVKSVDPGVTMDVIATVSSDRTAVTVALHPKVSTFLGFTRTPWAGSPRNVELMVQEPHVKTSELQTTVTIPNGGTVLLGGLEDPGIGGLNADDNSPPPSPRPGSPRGVYLLVRPTIIRNVAPEQKQFPLIKGENPGLNDAAPRLNR